MHTKFSARMLQTPHQKHDAGVFSILHLDFTRFLESTGTSIYPNKETSEIEREARCRRKLTNHWRTMEARREGVSCRWGWV